MRRGRKRRGRRGMGEEGEKKEERMKKGRRKRERKREGGGEWRAPRFPNQFLALSSLGYSSIFRICPFSEFE